MGRRFEFRPQPSPHRRQNQKMARDEEWSVKVRMASAAEAEALVNRLRSAGREAGRFGRRVSVAASDQHDAQALAGEIEADHPVARVEVRGD
jgi:hypothetical protein